MNRYNIWYWLLNKLGLGFFQQLFFGKEEGRPVDNTPKAMEQSPDWNSESWRAHSPPLILLTFQHHLVLVGPAQPHEADVKRFSSEFRGKAPESWENCGDITIISECSRWGHRLPRATQVESWGEKPSPLPFSHTTLPNQCSGSMRGLPWKGLGLSASSSV